MRKAILVSAVWLFCYSVSATHAQQALKVGLVMSYTGPVYGPGHGRWTTASSCT